MAQWATVGEVTESNLADGLVTIGDPLLDTEVLVRDADLREGTCQPARCLEEFTQLTTVNS